MAQGNFPLGLAMVFVCAVCFGSNFIVTKKFPMGDGMFFQWVMCAGIFCSGLVIWLVRGGTSHVWEPWACLGGALWCTGNIWVVPIVKCIGLGLGIVLWSSTNMLTGWASGRFGLFGLTKQTLSDPGMNTAGVVLAVLSIALFMFIKPESQQQPQHQPQRRGSNATSPSTSVQFKELRVIDDDEDSETGSRSHAKEAGTEWAAGWSEQKRYTFGVVMSLVSGAFYGSNFDPPQYIVDHRTDSRFMLDGAIPAPSHLVDYAFPHFCGIFFTSTLYFIAYCAYKRNQPVIFAEICLPGFTSGVVWAVAQTAWFIANDSLELPVAFPMVAVGPGIVAAAWGVTVLGEIRGLRNYLWLAGGFVARIASAVLIARSR